MNDFVLGRDHIQQMDETTCGDGTELSGQTDVCPEACLGYW